MALWHIVKIIIFLNSCILYTSYQNNRKYSFGTSLFSHDNYKRFTFVYQLDDWCRFLHGRSSSIWQEY